MTIENLRTEYHINPLGIDQTAPRLSWIVKADRRGAMQSAYRIIVASSRDKLNKGMGDLWDTGKVASSQANQIVYEGQPLGSGIRCYWKVKIWDENGLESGWSETALWSMGLLKNSDWQGQWIGWDAMPGQRAEESSTTLSLAPASWIWFPVGKPDASAPIGRYCFRRTFTVDPNRAITNALTTFTADNECTLWVNGEKVGSSTDFNAPSRADVTKLLKPGENVLAVQAANVGRKAGPAGLIGRMQLRFESGEPLEIVTDNNWKVTDKDPDDWQAARYDDTAWKDSLKLGGFGMNPWGQMTAAKKKRPAGKVYLPSPHLRKDFKVSGEVARATLYVTAQGHYEMRINGKRVGEDFFMPGWTDYRKRTYYGTYDVTSMLTQGPNAVGAILGDGWFRGNISNIGQNKYGTKLRLLTQLNIEYADGRNEIIVSDPSWKASFGPILESDMQAGETYDARLEMSGWDRAGFDESNWKPVDTGSSLKPTIEAYPGAPVRRSRELKTIKLTEPTPGTHVFNLGQNFSGWIRLTVKGDAGTRVVMRFGEMLNKDGTVYTKNLRSARATDTYICKGSGEETWEPHFTFHGFQFVQITGLPAKPGPEDVTGIVIHSDAPVTSSFECSNPMLNKLYNNTLWGQLSNYLEVPTDCPQRDERLGWTGDTQVFIRTGTYNQDVGAFFTKWIVDLMDTQQKSGSFGNQAPVFHGYGSPAWEDAGIVCPWTMLKVYGDTRLQERHYAQISRFVDYCDGRKLDGFGDWLAIGSETPKHVIGLAYNALAARMMAEIAEALGREADVKKYRDLFAKRRDKFQKDCVKLDGTIAGNSQTAYCLALYFDLLNETQRKQAADHLVKQIEAANYHLAVGFVGVPILLPTLSCIGRSDLAYRLIQNTTYPSWGYSIEQGSTTIWERWNSYTKDKGFGDVKMNSFNHYAYGSCGEWMFRTMLGIESDGNGFKKLLIAPEPGGGITYAKGHYDSIHGRIKTAWKVEGQRFFFNLAIPANTTATVTLPAKDAGSVKEGGKNLAASRGVTFLRMEGKKAVLAVDSGTYNFQAEM
jgi:alpha-L-rhamnosidase